MCVCVNMCVYYIAFFHSFKVKFAIISVPRLFNLCPLLYKIKKIKKIFKFRFPKFHVPIQFVSVHSLVRSEKI